MPVDHGPESFTGPWRELREAIEARMTAAGTWNLAIAPMVDEYVHGVRWAQLLREEARQQPTSTSDKTGRSFVHPAFAAADRITRTTREIGDALCLFDPLPPGAERDEFSELDELEKPRMRRQRRGGGRPPKSA